MEMLAKGCTGLAVLAFVLAVVANLMDTAIGPVTAEGFSRASANLALIAGAVVWTFRAR